MLRQILALPLALVALTACSGQSGRPAGTTGGLANGAAAAQTGAAPTTSVARTARPVTPAAEPSAASPVAEPTASPAASTESAMPAATSTVAEPGRAPFRGIWLDQEEIAALPVAGPAWEQLRAAAAEPLAEPDLADQDDTFDVYLLAKALVYARTGEEELREEVLDGLQAVIGAEGDAAKTSVLAIGRNLPSIVIAADLVNLPADAPLADAFRDWLRDLRETVFEGTIPLSLVTCHETRPNNWGTHCGAARIAIDRYLDDADDLERAATVFRGYLGDREAYADFVYGRLTWQADPLRPVGINPPGTTKDGHDIGGALPEEMRRAGDFRWPPKRTQYAWEALQGAITQAELLHRAGYPAWEWQDRALLRAVQFLYDLDWPARGDDEWQPWLLNHAYGTDFDAPSPARPGKNMAWTDWTHGPRDGALSKGDQEDD